MIHRFLALIAAVGLVGCSVAPVKLPVDNLALSEKTNVQDLRPVNEGTRDIFSINISSDRYGYIRLPQDATDPSGARLFAHFLQEKYGSAAVPSTKLHHFAVYLNNRTELRRGAMGAALGGAIGALIAGSTVKREGDAVHTLVDTAQFAALSGDDEYKRAMYTEPEIPADTTVFVIFIDSESEGKHRFTRTVWPIKPSQAGEKIPLHKAMDAAIKFNLGL